MNGLGYSALRFSAPLRCSQHPSVDQGDNR